MFHGSVGIVQEIEFEIRPDLGSTTLKTSRKWSWTIHLCVCQSSCRFLRELSQAFGLTDRVETLGAFSVIPSIASIFVAIRQSSKRGLAMACENLSNSYPIVMKFLGYLLLCEDTGAIYFGPNRSIPLAGHAPQVNFFFFFKRLLLSESSQEPELDFSNVPVAHLLTFSLL